MESGGRPSLGQFILLGTSSVVTAVLYSVYRQKAQVAQELKVSAGASLASVGSPLPPVMVSPPFASGLSSALNCPKEETGPREVSPRQSREELGSEFGSRDNRCTAPLLSRSHYSESRLHYLIRQILTGRLLCSRRWGCGLGRRDQSPCPHGDSILVQPARQ